MARSPGISGLALGLATAGGLLLYSGIKNQNLQDTLRDVLGNRPIGSSGSPTGPTVKGTTTDVDAAISKGFGTNMGSAAPASSPKIQAFLVAAESCLGKPYRWGAAGPDAFDCSGLVTWCLRQAGLDDQRRITSGYLVWSGATTIPTAQCAPGDLVCWTGHIGIAVSSTKMIHAPHTGTVVQEATFVTRTPPPVIRRIKG